MLPDSLKPLGFDTWEKEAWDQYQVRLNLPDNYAVRQFYRQVVYDHFEHFNEHYPDFQIEDYSFYQLAMTAQEAADSIRFFKSEVMDWWGAQYEDFEKRNHNYIVFQAMSKTRTFAGIDSIRSEIDGEIQTLTLNEQSRRAFELFGDICNKSDCGLFLVDSASYAKNLLYLKDQIKDLEANAVRAEVQLEELDRRIEEDENDRQLILSKLEALPQNASTEKLISAVQALTKEILEIEQKRAAIGVLAEQRRKYYQLESERDKLQDRIASLTSNVRGELEFLQLRAKIRESLVRWMDILHTLNVSHEIEIDQNFRFKFGPEGLDLFTGSTRSRLVLAIHAAMFEAYLENPDREFRFLILDTPKQHELNGADLANYLKELQLVCDKYRGQIIISSTEYRHSIGEHDKEWLPEYPGTDQPMYLGKPGTRLPDVSDLL